MNSRHSNSYGALSSSMSVEPKYDGNLIAGALTYLELAVGYSFSGYTDREFQRFTVWKMLMASVNLFAQAERTETFEIMAKQQLKRKRHVMLIKAALCYSQAMKHFAAKRLVEGASALLETHTMLAGRLPFRNECEIVQLAFYTLMAA